MEECRAGQVRVVSTSARSTRTTGRRQLAKPRRARAVASREKRRPSHTRTASSSNRSKYTFALQTHQQRRSAAWSGTAERLSRHPGRFNRIRPQPEESWRRCRAATVTAGGVSLKSRHAGNGHTTATIVHNVGAGNGRSHMPVVPVAQEMNLLPCPPEWPLQRQVRRYPSCHEHAGPRGPALFSTEWALPGISIMGTAECHISTAMAGAPWWYRRRRRWQPVPGKRW